MLKTIDADLYDWVEYNTRLLETSGLGFSQRTPVGRMIDEGAAPPSNPPGCRVPLLKTASGRVRDIDRVLRVLPDNLLALVREHYIERTTRKSRGLSRKLDRLHWTIQGALLIG